MANDHSVGMAVKQNPIGKYKLLAVGINDACNKNRAPGKSCVFVQLLFCKKKCKKEVTKNGCLKKNSHNTILREVCNPGYKRSPVG